MRSIAVPLSLFATLLLATHALGQVGTATLTGAVTDATDAPVPSAEIKILNTDSGISLRAATNEGGLWRVNTLPPGKYSVEASAKGFDTAVRAGITLSTAQTLAVDLKLQVGQQSQSVLVTERAELAETQSASISQVVTQEYIQNLPLPNRSANSLVTLSPGVVMIDPGQGAENYPVFSVAGGRARNQSFTLDGGSIGNAVGLTRPQQVASLPLDALQEFRIVTNNYAAEYGHSTGGIVALTTRSGTNNFHGSVFEYLRNDALDARNFFARTKPPLRLNQYGGALGGPIQKDKTHFFASWEHTAQTQSDTVTSTVPTLAERTGDFSAVSARIYDATAISGTTKQAFAGNIIPPSRLDAVAKAAAAYWPSPTGNGFANNYIGNSVTALNRNIVVGKLDRAFSNNDRVSARYYINDATSTVGGSYGIPVSDPLATNTDVRFQSALGTWTRSLGNSAVNNFQVSFMQRKFLQTRAGANADYAGKLGLLGVDKAAFPTFNVTGYGLLGSQGVTNSSIARLQTPIRDTQLQDSFSKFIGKHAFKAGLEYRFGYNNESNNLSSSGNIAFSRLYTDQSGQSTTTGDAFATFLLGAGNSASLSKTDVIPSRASYWSAYLQDDYRITPKLTLNIGLRWETETPRTVDGNKLNGFDPYAINPVSKTPGVVAFAGRNGTPSTSFDPNYFNFGPRFGFAWTAPRGIVVRGGSGIFYGPNVSTSITTSATLGYSDNFSVVTSQAETSYALILAQGFPAYTRPAIDTPGFGAVAPGQKATTAVQFFDRHRPTPVSYQFNLDLQKEVVRNVLVELGYIGNVSHHLTGNDVTINQVPTSLFGPGDTTSKRPFPQFSNVTSLNPAIGNSSYHGVFVKTERRFANGFSFLAHYTFSKFIDDIASGDEFGDPGSYQDQYNRRLDKGLSGSDVPNRLIFTGLYRVPSFRANKLLDRVAGGWEMGTETTIQSGENFTVYDAANTTNGFPAGTLRPNLVGNPRLDSGSTLQHYFNTAAFVHPANYTFGNSPRSVLRGPGSRTVDFSVSKTFDVVETVHAEFRAGFFNVFNFANFDLPGHTLGNNDFGILSSARPARTTQLALRILF
jgi:hypothetical protein